VSNFIVSALKGAPLTIYGNGSQTRSFCYVDDMVDAMVRMMGTDPDVAGPVNIGNPVEMTIRELAHTVLRIVGSSSPIEYRPLPGGDPRQRQPDITLARRTLNWEPSVPLALGLELTLAYFRETVADLTLEGLKFDG
jgi:UDP-glucuronate decarboxylase